MLIGEVSRLLGPVGKLARLLKHGEPEGLSDRAAARKREIPRHQFRRGAAPPDIQNFFKDIDKILDNAQAAANFANDLKKLPKTITETVYEAAEDVKQAAKDAVDDAVEAVEGEIEKAKNEIANQIPKEIRARARIRAGPESLIPQASSIPRVHGQAIPRPHCASTRCR